jgi:hypothetical protein
MTDSDNSDDILYYVTTVVLPLEKDPGWKDQNAPQ